MNNILKYVMFVWLFGVFCFAILMPIPAIGTMGEKSRILFFHVPMSWVASVAFIMALVYGIMYIRKKDVIYDYKAASSAALGLLFSVLATATGAVWAKFEWGAFWNWDPRQTAIDRKSTRLN